MKKTNQRLILAKDISKEFNIPYPTINHYTNLGFLTVVKRSGNRRLYDRASVRIRLRELSKLVEKGYPLRLIRRRLVD